MRTLRRCGVWSVACQCGTQRALLIRSLLLVSFVTTPTDATARLVLTGESGGFVSHPTVQPSLALTYLVRIEGAFLELGEIKLFAGNFAPRGWALADGSTLPISGNSDLFDQLGTTYGGDGTTDFALPDLRGRAAIGTDAANGLLLGSRRGAELATTSIFDLPRHRHGAPAPFSETNDSGGFGAPVDNMQPSLALHHLVSLKGIFPSPNVTGGQQGKQGFVSESPYVGAVAITAGQFTPDEDINLADEWARADGELVPVISNFSLFALLGTTFGGDGNSTFGLPDIRGRVPIHPGSGPGLTERSWGEKFGSNSTAYTVDQMPSHHHTLPGTTDVTENTGGGEPIDNMQASLGLRYAIAIQGRFPFPNATGEKDKNPDGLTSIDPFLGEVGIFAGDFAPRGWLFAEGQELPISTNSALFALLGFTYGGDGASTFRLPDLRGRVAVGAGPGMDDYPLGSQFGDETFTLSLDNLPPHIHLVEVVPEPTSATLAALLGIGLLASARRRQIQRLNIAGTA